MVRKHVKKDKNKIIRPEKNKIRAKDSGLKHQRKERQRHDTSNPNKKGTGQ
jgi:hypothetical protein